MSHLQEIAVDGDEGFDAVAEVSTLPRKEEGLLRGGGGGVCAKKKHGESLLPSFDDLALRAVYMTRRRDLASHCLTTVRRHWRLEQRGS